MQKLKMWLDEATWVVSRFVLFMLTIVVGMAVFVFVAQQGYLLALGDVERVAANFEMAVGLLSLGDVAVWVASKVVVINVGLSMAGVRVMLAIAEEVNDE